MTSGATTLAAPARQFASDNNSGICPEAIDVMLRANEGHAPGYGDDKWTQRAADLLRDLFETDCEVFFVFNGTAANALALASLCQSYHSIVCHQVSHIETDECGAPEFFSNGTKVLVVDGPLGKVDLQAVSHAATRRRDIHYPKPRVLSLTQSTEVGTVYTVAELAAAREVAHRHHLHIHMDGARFANAAASLGVAPREITWRAGVDVLCFGGTKNGMAVGDAVIFFNKNLAREFDYRCKQAGQLASKMRFLAAPWVGLLETGAWLRNAQNANAAAASLAGEMRTIPGVEVLYPTEANAVFAKLDDAVAGRLKRGGWTYYSFIGGGARFMCSWDTTRRDIDALVSCVRG